MAVKANATISLYRIKEVTNTTIYYLLQSSTANPPAKPTTDNPGGNWSTTEPTYTEGSTNTLYTVTKTKYSDGSFEYTPVSKSSSYEAAKSAYNKALNAENIANAAEKKIYHTCSSSGGTSGYFYFARCVIVTSYCNKPISFTINNRGIDQTDVELRFANDSGKDPAVSILKKNGKANVYIVKADTSTWDLYVQKTESYDSATFTRFNMNGYDSKFTWTWKDQTVTSLPSDHITAVGTGEIIVGTQTAATGSWTGIANFDTLKDGQEITYWLPYAGSGNATLNLTLSGGNTTGAIPCYYSGASRITTHYAAGNVIHLTYRVNANVNGSKYTGWWADANYADGNNTDRLRFQNNIKTGKQYVWSNRVLVSDSDGYFPLHGEVSFDRDKALLLAGSNIGPYSTGNNNYIAYPGWDLRYNAYQYYSNSTWTNGTLYNRLPIEIPSGNKIYSGTAITGTSTTATIFSDSGITNATVNDRYINTSNGNYYKCTTAGNASAAKWVYEGNSVIPVGKRLYWGTHLTHTDGTSKNTATGIATAGVGDVYINHATGRLYQCDTAGASGTAKWKDYGIRMQTNKTVYLVGILTGNTILVDSWPFTTEPPTEDDGKIYIAIGMAYQVYACGLFPEHPMFMYKDGMFKSMEQITYDSLVVAKDAASTAESAKTKIQNFLEGDASTEGSFEAYKREVNRTINTSTGEIVDHFSTYMRNSEFGQTLLNSSELLEKIDSYIKMKTNSQGQPYLELGVQPTQSIPNTYRLRLENDEIYMVYGSGDTESLTHLTSWSTKDGKSKFEVNTLVTQEEMAIEPFRFIKNDDGSLSFRKVE